jgi:excisionase family DNA binding protein
MADDVMTTAQAAQYLHIGLATLERWTRAGVVPVVKWPGRRRVLFRKEALEQRLRDHQRGRGDAPKS